MKKTRSVNFEEEHLTLVDEAASIFGLSRSGMIAQILRLYGPDIKDAALKWEAEHPLDIENQHVELLNQDVELATQHVDSTSC